MSTKVCNPVDSANINWQCWPVSPVAKPRMTQRDRWKTGREARPAVKKYRLFCDAIRAHGVTLEPGGQHVLFVFPMPTSWSKAKRATMRWQPHQQRPDVDNLMKALCDALFEDDSVVYDWRITKIWGEVGAIYTAPIPNTFPLVL